MSITLSLEAEAGGGAQVVTIEAVLSLDELEGPYDVLEVWRSREANGPFEELTAESYQPARVPKDAGDPPSVPVTGTLVYLVDKTLSLLLDEESTLDVLFTGTDPLTYAEAASQIESNSLGTLTSWVDADGALVVATVAVGSSSSLRVLGSEAAPLLRLATSEPDCLSFGKDARLPLVLGQEVYVYVDHLGSSENLYRVRLRSTSTEAASAFSDAAGTPQILGLPRDNIAIGELNLVTAAGLPLVGQEVRVHTRACVAPNGSYMAGNNLSARTDAKGHMELRLVRGLRCAISVVGLDLVRDILVPSNTSVKRFNLLDPAVGLEDDAFKVQTPNTVYAERRSL